MAEAIKARNPKEFAVILPLNEYEPLVALSLQQDEPLLRDGGRYGNFRGEGFRRALEFYLGMFRQGSRLPPTTRRSPTSGTSSPRGTSRSTSAGRGRSASSRRRLPREPAGTLDDRRRCRDRKGPGHSIAGGCSLAIFRRSRAKEAAWRVVEYLSRPQTQRRFHEMTGNLPPRRASWSGVLEGDAYARAFREQLDRVKPAPKVPEWERIAQEMRLVTERVVRGDFPAAEAPAELDRRADRMLEKRRWMLARAKA
jgi:multiple sugar transport system substrate-binding protein